MLRTARHVAVVNSRVAGFVARVAADPERVISLSNGVDRSLYFPVAGEAHRRELRLMLGLPPDEVLVLFVGRPVPKKGIDLLLEAAGDDVSVVVAGGELAAPRPGGRVITLGAVSQDLLADVYRACDIFVLPSEAEGFRSPCRRPWRRACR